MMDTTLPRQQLQRSPGPAILFVLSSMWIVVALAGGRLAGTVVSAFWYDLGRQSVTAAMLFGGFYLLARLGVKDLRPLSSVGFVRRPGLLGEFGVGAAAGWCIGLAMVLPAALSGNMALGFDFSAAAVQRTLLNSLVLASWALALQLVLSGLPMRLLVRSTRPAWAVTCVLLLTAGMSATDNLGQSHGVLFPLLTVGLFLTAFLRTRAIWLPLGLQIGWTFSLQLLFGVRSAFTPSAAGVIQNATDGPTWLTGSPYAQDASLGSVVILLVALLLLFRVTRTYAWHYTFQPIVAAGYPVEVRPPAEHAKEEQRVQQTMPLVQINGLLQTPPSDTSIHKL